MLFVGVFTYIYSPKLPRCRWISICWIYPPKTAQDAISSPSRITVSHFWGKPKLNRHIWPLWTWLNIRENIYYPPRNCKISHPRGSWENKNPQNFNLNIFLNPIFNTLADPWDWDWHIFTKPFTCRFGICSLSPSVSTPGNQALYLWEPTPWRFPWIKTGVSSLKLTTELTSEPQKIEVLEEIVLFSWVMF